MAQAHSIQCADCNAEYVTKRRNTKYCSVCRLFRDLMFLGNRKTKCLVCERPFALIKAGEKLCPECDVIPSSMYRSGPCAFCRLDQYPLLSQDVAVCTRCAHDPEQRELLIKAVVQKRNSRAGAVVTL